ncbi:MAG: 4-(cytidine 5'-diphospho)-2-C-methyl-D-erythritol kinase [Hyphomicrobiales bacterium]|nr:4-(cytidine 5'-diphospho)-2-C-methyl-D-erythritol kinase [Hyphomicrobiales bacterium]MDE2114946.1 4-(cytidine 5'-diphospho)-2-C-methyl-D-erythritol kinase [Hyphomicrobiales bacterium]
MRIFAKARAKLNLTLSVKGRRLDGYHEISSLVAFAGVSDGLCLQPARELSLTVSGASAEAAGQGEDNLVLVAARHFSAQYPQAQLGQFHLFKQLPVAAGVGGGSADAAAALRLLAQANGMKPDCGPMLALAALIGADVPVCLASRARHMAGIGEQLGPPMVMPQFYVVLVNPGVKLETRAVFSAMGLAPGQSSFACAEPPIRDGMDAAQWLAALRRSGNDMEDAAASLAPVIVSVLAVLAGARGCRLARMSGSGATCFGLFENRRDAMTAAMTIKTYHPAWWVKASLLRG